MQNHASFVASNDPWYGPFNNIVLTVLCYVTINCSRVFRQFSFSCIWHLWRKVTYCLHCFINFIISFADVYHTNEFIYKNLIYAHKRIADFRPKFSSQLQRQRLKDWNMSHASYFNGKPMLSQINTNMQVIFPQKIFQEPDAIPHNILLITHRLKKKQL